MADALKTLSNRLARRLWLHLQGMLESPHNKSSNHCAIDTVRQLGMVQLDSINTLARAHHHILWSRQQSYRPDDYNLMLGSKPSVFEHFSHDAVILPMDIYPFWQCQRQRRARQYKIGTWGKNLPVKQMQNQILRSIEVRGPMCSRDFSAIYSQKADKSLHAWMRPPHKLALDYLWMQGALCVSHRAGFIKYYELCERVIPLKYTEASYTHSEQCEFLCQQALQRLGFASATDIQKFHDALTLTEVKRWLVRESSRIESISLQTSQGDNVSLYAFKDIFRLVQSLPEPAQRLRIVSPFDPIARDRIRLQQLFGMDYRIEIYTPAAKRKYGYYVYPILEADRFTARIDVRANKANNTLDIRAWWLEPGIRHSNSRVKRLRSELARLAKLAGVSQVGEIPSPTPHPH